MTTSPFMFQFTPTGPGGVVTPASTAQYVARVDNEVESLYNDILIWVGNPPTNPIASKFKLDYEAWRSGWALFRDSLLSLGGAILGGWEEGYRQTAQWEAQWQQWRQKFIGLGGKPSGVVPEDIADVPSPWASAVKWAVVGAVALSAAAIVYEVRK